MRRVMAVVGLGSALALGAACEEARRAPTPFQPATTLATTGGTYTGGGTGGEGPELEDIVDPEAPCDDGLAIDESDPRAAARALELCQTASGSDWGVVSAKWVLADGDDTDPALATGAYALGHGVLDGFGDEIAPLAGARLLALSSGTARQPDDPGWVSPAGFSKNYQGSHPSGFPKAAPACGLGAQSGPAYDQAALEVTLRPPAEALAFAFDFDFYTYEWPDYVCSAYNDVFATILSPKPSGQTDGNVSFDQEGNPVSVNTAFVQVCDCVGGPPCVAPPDFPKIAFDCDLGPGELSGTGFEDRAATGWLTTEAPIVPGEDLTLRFVVYDAGDHILDTTVLIDNFRWRQESEGSPITRPK
jgi:hypothetical protein